MKNKFYLSLILLAFLFFVENNLFAHEGHHHADPSHGQMQHPVGDSEKKKFSLINEKYLSDVKPIFQRSCFDCHSSQTRYPWYYKIPGVKQLVESDIKEAKEHLDFEKDFPFKSHAMPLEDLKAISDEIAEDGMPPLRYRLLHSEAKLTEDEKGKITNWVNFSKDTLGK